MMPSDDQLLTLEHAAEIYLGDRKKVATLRAEVKRENLVVSKIGRNYWTTLGRLKEMEEKCRVEAQAPSSGGTKPAKPGPSSTDESEAAQAAAQAKLQERRKHLGITSRRSTR